MAKKEIKDGENKKIPIQKSNGISNDNDLNKPEKNNLGQRKSLPKKNKVNQINGNEISMNPNGYDTESTEILNLTQSRNEKNEGINNRKLIV